MSFSNYLSSAYNAFFGSKVVEPALLPVLASAGPSETDDVVSKLSALAETEKSIATLPEVASPASSLDTVENDAEEDKNDFVFVDEISPIEDFVWVDQDTQALTQEEIDARADVTRRLKAFALAERLGHTKEFAYGAMTRLDGAHLRIHDELYEVIKIKTDSTGLVGEVLFPVNPNANQNIYINWTGTHSLGTVLADLETAPGEESYRNEEMQILSQINEIVANFKNKTDKKANIVLSGHSLGGALSQLNFHTLQRAIATNSYEANMQSGDDFHVEPWIKAEQQYRTAMNTTVPHVKKDMPLNVRSHLDGHSIESLSLGVWNSAGILEAVETSSNQLAKIVADRGVQQRAYFGTVGGDMVQTTGQGNVLSNVESADAEVSLLKMNNGQKGFTEKCVFSVLGSATAAAAGTMLLNPPLALVGGLTFGMLPMGKATAISHRAKHFITEPIFDENSGQFFDPVRAELYANNTCDGKKVIQESLKNKSYFLQWAPVKTAQSGLYYLLSHVISAKKAPVKVEMENVAAPVMSIKY